jgi:hypothetical protein
MPGGQKDKFLTTDSWAVSSPRSTLIVPHPAPDGQTPVLITERNTYHPYRRSLARVAS